MRRKSKQNEQTLTGLNPAHRRSQEKCQLVQTSQVKTIKLFLFAACNKHNRGKLVCVGES